MSGLFVYWASLIARLIKNLPAMQETPVRFLGHEDPLEKGCATHSSILGLSYGSAGKESTCNAGDLGSIPGYSGLENSMGCIDPQSWTRLNDFHFYSLYTGLFFESESVSRSVTANSFSRVQLFVTPWTVSH